MFCQFCYDIAEWAWVTKTHQGKKSHIYLCEACNADIQKKSKELGIKEEKGMAEDYFKGKTIPRFF